jgi:uncharacterized protein (UPF0276 family)
MNETLTIGLGLKAEHFDQALACDEAGLWFEVHPENHMAEGGPRLAWLEAVRARHPVALHSVSLSLAGPTPPDAAQLRRLAVLARRLQPVLVSEHLAWSRLDGRYFPDLLPFPRDNTALARIAAHIDQVQCALGRPIAIENPAHYLPLPGHAWDEIDFLAELARRSGCLLLLDVNNVFVSARNLGAAYGSAGRYIDRFPAAPLAEVHLAGHSTDPALGEALLIDSHDAPVAPAVWDLYRRLVARTGPRPTLIERDGNIPPFDALLAERATALDVAAAPEAVA